MHGELNIEVLANSLVNGTDFVVVELHPLVRVLGFVLGVKGAGSCHCIKLKKSAFSPKPLEKKKCLQLIFKVGSPDFFFFFRVS